MWDILSELKTRILMNCLIFINVIKVSFTPINDSEVRFIYFL